MASSPKVKGVKSIVILVLILAVPGFLYYLLTAHGKNRYKPLPIFGPKIVAKTTHKGFHGATIPDTIYHFVGDFKLTDQDGKPVTLKNLDGKVTIFSFFFSNCPTVCNEVNTNVDSLAHAYINNKMVQFISVTVDPQRDDIRGLKNYSAKFGLPASKWGFLTGDTSAIYTLARNGLFVNAARSGAGKNDLIYDGKLILVDAVHRIRGYYIGTSTTDITRLNDEIRVQIVEELRKREGPEM